jgi:uncharacterized protein (TIGR02145 family)
MAEDLMYQGGTYYCYDDNSGNCSSYSVLYDSLAATTACPSGWHLPSDAEWQTLEKSIGFSDADTAATGSYRGDATSLKSGGSSGFNLNTYTGYYSGTNYFSNTTNAYYWSRASRYRRFSTTDNGIFRPSALQSPDQRRMCIRCLKN